MQANVRALFTEIVDYAGLFPPAKLPLEQALSNYDRHRQGPESWLLGRFVCPAARLAELVSFAGEHFPPQRPLTLVVLGSGEPSRDWQAITEIRRRLPGQINVAAYECKWNEGADLPGHGQTPTFLEVALGTVWDTAVAKAIELLARHTQPESPLGLKLRCGGETAAAFPTFAQVARVLVSCRDAALAVKFTAGLHHPLRHLDSPMGVTHHGFLNVFAAGVLAHARNLDEPTVRRIIEEEDAGSFHFTDDRLAWREWSASATEIAAARRLVTSFGSCSFEEPVADLRELGLI